MKDSYSKEGRKIFPLLPLSNSRGQTGDASLEEPPLPLWVLAAPSKTHTKVISHSSPSVTHSGKVNASSISVCAYMLSTHAQAYVYMHTHHTFHCHPNAPSCLWLTPKLQELLPLSGRSSQLVIPGLLVPWDGSFPEPWLALSESLMAHL